MATGQTLPAPRLRPDPPHEARRVARRPAAQLARRGWVVGAVALVAVSVLFVLLTGMRPAYDPYGWLVWGYQAAHLKLNTDAAPSWKPLTFLFTFPYVLLVGRAAVWVWMVTAMAGALAAPVLAGRIGYWLVAPRSERRYPALVAAVIAGVGVFGIEDYSQFVLVATADPLMVALCLGAIDAALCRRLRLAWALLILVCLGRPEAAPLAVLCAAWAWRRKPALRPWLVAGLTVIPLLWFGAAALTSSSWMIAGTVLGESTRPLAGNKFLAVMSSLRSLYELPMQLAVVAAIGLAVLRRERIWLLIAGAAMLWVAVEVALAYHGWGISPRYLFEPTAMLVVLAAAGAGYLLTLRPRRRPLLRWVAVAAVLGLSVALATHVPRRARADHNEIALARAWARQIHRLQVVIAKEGGPKQILACGQAVTEVPVQTLLAWELGQNVIDVGWDPPTWIGLGAPIVVFEPKGNGWVVRPVHSFFASDPARCSRLATTTPTQ